MSGSGVGTVSMAGFLRVGMMETSIVCMAVSIPLVAVTSML